MNSQLLIGTFRHNVSFQVEQILYLEINSKFFTLKLIPKSLKKIARKAKFLRQIVKLKIKEIVL